MKKKLIALTAIVVAVVAVLLVGVLADPTTAVQSIESDSPCPVTGCANGQCHGFADVPNPDGIHEMACPEASCSSVECHAWDALTSRYHQASDMSLNVWIIMPVVLVLVLWAIARYISKRDNRGDNHAKK